MTASSIATIPRLIRDAFAKKYRVHLLVHVEFHETMADAIVREKHTKTWRRAWKPELIERDNPQGRDLYEERTSSGSADGPRIVTIDKTVIPAQAGIEGRATGFGALDSRLRGNDRGAKCDCPAPRARAEGFDCLRLSPGNLL
jgi:hypothetical protein